MPSNVTAERRRLLELYGAEIVDSPGEEGSNGAVRLALELAAADSTYFMPFQYANEANPRAHYDGTGAEIAAALDRVDVLVAGLGTGGTLMGAGERLRETFPDVVIAAAEPLPGDEVMGLRSLEDGYVPPILDVSKLDRKLLVTNAEAVAGLRLLLEREGVLGGVSSGAVIHAALRLAERARRGRHRVRSRRRRLEVPLRGLLGRGRRRALDGAVRLVVVPAAVRGELVAHAQAESPNEACGIVVSKNGVAERYIAGRNAAASPYRFELDVPPETWFLEDDGYELAVFHSHLSSPPRPSRTDVENVGLWAGRPYLIYTVRTGELAGWRISSDSIEPLELTAD